MPTDYRNHHFVPQWYQRRFVPADRKNRKLLYLDLSAGFRVDPSGACQPQWGMGRQGFRRCFAVDDLYTLQLGTHYSRDIEKFFFGEIDNLGRPATEYFNRFAHPSMDDEALHNLLRFMSVQKLRTPKGLYWLRKRTGARTRNEVLLYMQELADMHAATWLECVWLIADASDSPTKLIVSDHPVTVYNQDCRPNSRWCADCEDPDIRYHGTHTMFPLSMDKVLIMTNLSWARNPFQSARGLRPNPKLFRPTMFDWREIQVMRKLTEPEVISINYIIKKRADRFIGAADEAWLFPERRLPTLPWRKFGAERLLMPDPRSMVFTGEMMWRNRDGSHGAIDEYGLQPWEAGFASKARADAEWPHFQRFKGEFARFFGPERRGRAFRSLRLDPAHDSDAAHQANLECESEFDRFFTD